MSKLRRLIDSFYAERLRCISGVKKSHAAGFPRELLMAWFCNIEAHRKLITLPGMRDLLVEHALDTDDLETSFGMLVQR